MRRWLLSCVLLSTAVSALAEDESPWSGALSGNTTFVSGPTGEAFNPSLRLGLRLDGARALSEHVDLGASWRIERQQILCDTCGDGLRTPGTRSGHPVDLGDLRLSLSHGRVAESKGGTRLSLGLDAALPASREALVCNPFYGAIGAGATVKHPVGDAKLSTELGFSRSFFRYAAAPIGRCGLPADDLGVSTLTGTVAPTPWTEQYGAANTDWTGAVTLTATDPHRWLIGGLPRLKTSARIGANLQRLRTDGATTVETLTGPVAVDRAHAPVAAAFPMSIGAGWALSEGVGLSLSLANTLPGIIDDPGTFYRNIPSRTAATVGVKGQL